MVNNSIQPLFIIGVFAFTYFMTRPLIAGKFHPKHYFAVFAEFLFFMILAAVVIWSYQDTYPSRYGDELWQLTYTGGAGYHLPSIMLGVCLVLLTNITRYIDLWKPYRLGLDLKRGRK